MTLETKTSPPHSVILIMDVSGGLIPESMNRQLISATSSCVAIGTRLDIDGLTNIILSDERPSGQNNLNHVCTKEIVVPSGELAIFTVFNELLLSLKTDQDRCKFGIWCNDNVEPDIIVVSTYG